MELDPNNPLDLAWVAGFLDGEGAFGIRVSHRKRDVRVLSTAPVIRVAQSITRREPIDALRSAFGGTIQNKHMKNPNHTGAVEWVATGHAATRFCQMILPYLRCKRRHAEIIIEFQATKLPDHIGVRKGRPRDELRVSEEIMQKRTLLMQELAALNARGKGNGKSISIAA